MRNNNRNLLTVLAIFTSLVLTITGVSLEERTSAQKPVTHPDGSTTTSEDVSLRPTGYGTKETTKDKNGKKTKEETKDDKGTVVERVEYGANGTVRIWEYDRRGRLILFVMKWTQGGPFGDEGALGREIKYKDDYDTIGTGTDYARVGIGGLRLATDAETTFLGVAIKPDPLATPNPGSNVAPGMGQPTINVDSVIGDLFPGKKREQNQETPKSNSAGPETPQQPTAKPTPKVEIDPKYKIEFKTSPGLNTETLTLPSGSKISINLPDDMSAGDTITGTVQTEVAGKDEKQRAKNQAELEKIQLRIGGQSMPATGKMFTRSLPANLDIKLDERFILIAINGKQVCSVAVPLAQNPPPAPQNPQLPTCGQMGRNVVVKDHCDGIISPTDSCSIGGTQLQPLAESPRMRVMQNTSEVPGLTEIKYSEQGKEVTGPFQNLGVKLTSPNTNLLRGQKTTLEVIASVQGIQQVVSLDLVNDTPGIVSISGGDDQHFTIHPTDVQGDGTYKQNFTVTANQAGAWGATATVSCVGQGVGGPAAGGPQAAASPVGVAAPGTLAPLDCVRACVRDGQPERGNCPRCLSQLDCVRACVRAAGPAGVAAFGTPTPTPAPAHGHPTPSPGPTSSTTPCDPAPTPTTYTVKDLKVLPTIDGSMPVCMATGVNDAGNVVGACMGESSSAYLWRAFRTDAGGAVITADDNLGVPAGITGGVSFATAVNAAGHVVGVWGSALVPMAFKAFWHDGSKTSKMINLHPDMSKFTTSRALAVNIHDDVVGLAYGVTVGPGSAAGSPFGGHAVIWPHVGADPMMMTDLMMTDLNDALADSVKKDWILIAAFGISDDGDIVGRALNTKLGKYHAFLLKGVGGKFFDLGALKEDTYDSSAAYALNPCGATVPEIDKVVGYTYTKTFHYGFVWTEASGLMDMETVPLYSTEMDPLESYAQAINKKGEVVGAASAYGSETSHLSKTLDALSFPSTAGCVPYSHAVWYNGKELKDLNELIPGSPGWKLSLANGINEKGWIAGSGFYKCSTDPGSPPSLAKAVLLIPAGSSATTATGPFPAPAPGPTGLTPTPTTAGGGYIFDNWNTYGVWSAPTMDTTFTIDKPYYITSIEDYHWNDGKGALPGGKGISLKSSDGTVYGPWPVTPKPGQGGAPNVNWECKPTAGFTLPAGTYTVVDPDPATWSLNAASGSSGFCRIAGYPKK